jgi:hypothetical protein
MMKVFGIATYREREQGPQSLRSPTTRNLFRHISQHNQHTSLSHPHLITMNCGVVMLRRRL